MEEIEDLNRHRASLQNVEMDLNINQKEKEKKKKKKEKESPEPKILKSRPKNKNNNIDSSSNEESISNKIKKQPLQMVQPKLSAKEAREKQKKSAPLTAEEIERRRREYEK